MQMLLNIFTNQEWCKGYITLNSVTGRQNLKLDKVEIHALSFI